MATLMIEVADLDSVKERMRAAFHGQPQGCRYTFRSEQRLLETLNPNRWAIVKALTGAGPLGVRELARRVGRDVKGVHTDAQALVKCGLIDKTEDGKLLLPYDQVRVELECRAVA
jgi:predicted transcriptional regulator